MNYRKIAMGLLVVCMADAALGSGFALYEPSVISHAMGGALIGKAMDASANFNNPATLTDLTNTWISVGFVTEHPRGNVRGHTNYEPWGQDQTMDPGFFTLPHVQFATPLPYGFAFGLGVDAEYGLGTEYADRWIMNWNVKETTVQGLVINPNLAYAVTEAWSVGAGVRWLYFDFEQYSNPIVSAATPFGMADFGQMSNRLKGDNDFRSIGWQVGTKYDITEDFSVGLVYKSAIDVTVKGKTANSPLVASSDPVATAVAGMYGMTVGQFLEQQALQRTGAANADLRLPQSIVGGCNWDVSKTWHLGAAVSWTQWSEFDQLHFNLRGGDKDVKLNWCDTWRGTLASCWDFAEDWKWMISYVYDMDSTDSSQTSAMLPPADRHIASTGFTWDCWAGMQLGLSYSCVFMDGMGMDVESPLGDRYHLETCRGFCHAVGFSVSYRF